ncbi:MULTISPECIES: quinoprotein dehydrogenase-associated putative ABC transporter substrate-binding protein [unclassified Sphingomonas]|uniref:quinoprotein dehydrogenase-associated putative ABC transporter substrate-binding protein n=1 Tax=unclassified Sphingomonas TaxID=196159 RepID=UPI0006F877FF|nr:MULTISPECIES: quinoprotein dehydrogenase-associated putative ABC transporter substrate-binding protein [unclassified Sphingomonas]KQX17654.1 amino acid ABC transporter substrate-binding protein [Sphingomonas sp. Root1294]KQY70580.1 amino acid ABC transporter substrate-binding protein [Sphingomonas sp. Root50]KRB91930.1 amino acid ABC transporter substrate-binding protein [Sphingomonas sp. Root720]
MKQIYVLICLLLCGCRIGAPEELLVCADPNNLPFSNRAGEGFENRIVQLVAKDLGRDIRYVWWAQRRGYVRNTLGEAKCDLWPGVAAGVEMVATTRPYYRSSYMFVTRVQDKLSGLTLDDPRLASRKLGVQLVGDDAMNTPPAHALARRSLTRNVAGFMLYGDYRQPNPPTAIVEAVADGRIDIGLVWGPLAGWFAKHSRVPLRLEPVTPWLDDAQWPMVYEVSMGVRKDEPALKLEIERSLDRNASRIADILESYGLPDLADHS